MAPRLPLFSHVNGDWLENKQFLGEFQAKTYIRSCSNKGVLLFIYAVQVITKVVSLIY